MLDATGRLKFFQLEDQALILEYKTDNIITKFHPCTAGTRLVCNGSAGMNTVFVAADDTMIDIRGYPAKTEKVSFLVGEFIKSYSQDHLGLI